MLHRRPARGSALTWWRPNSLALFGGTSEASWVPGCCAAEFDIRAVRAVPAGDLVLVDVAQEARLRFLPDFVAPWVVWNHIVLRLGESREGRWATLTFHPPLLYSPSRSCEISACLCGTLGGVDTHCAGRITRWQGGRPHNLCLLWHLRHSRRCLKAGGVAEEAVHHPWWQCCEA